MIVRSDSRARSARGRRRAFALAAIAALAGVASACSDLLTAPLPAGTKDPSSFANEAGALGRYRFARDKFVQVFTQEIVTAGGFADELHDANLGGFVGQVINPLDERILPEPMPGTAESVGGIENLLTSRAHFQEAIGALQKYAPTQRAARGQMYAHLAWLEIALAEGACSGIPLSTVDFEGDFTYRAGSTSAEVYRHALAQLDTALALSGDSARIMSLAKVERGRALLDLGEFAAAAQAVADVPDGFRFEVVTDWRTQSSGAAGPLDFWSMSDREGLNGMDYISSGDPRTPFHQRGVNSNGLPIFAPDARTGVQPVTVAGAVEARLIEAEAALRVDDGRWLDMLNALRTDGTFDTRPDDDDPTRTDTLWHAGTGAVAGLRPLSDPGTTDGRVDLLFRERAFWLFLTTSRQGDLRRLLRQYGRRQDRVYPTGAYAGGVGVYGSDVTRPMPANEWLNPLFTGCIDRNP